MYGRRESKSKGSKRGPKPTDPRWTRLVKLNPNSDNPIPVFSYIKDANVFFVDSDSEDEGLLSDRPIIITHDSVEYEGIVLDEENFRLSESELSQYAK